MTKPKHNNPFTLPVMELTILVKPSLLIATLQYIKLSWTDLSCDNMAISDF